MLTPAASFAEFVLGIHILAVVVSFGVLFVYPLLGLIGARLDPTAVPSFHRLQLAVHLRVSAPGLAILFLAGIYLASDEHQWSKFYVGWGVVAVLAISGIGGAYIARRERRLIELAEREVAAVPGAAAPAVPAASAPAVPAASAPAVPAAAAPAPGGSAGSFSWSDEYLALRRQVELARLLQVGIATLTIFFMALHLGA